jgi:hypothetical protein
MAHVLMLIDAPASFNKDCPGHSDVFLRNLDEKKYYLNNVRQGYFRPFASELRMINYRVLREVIPYAMRDCGAIVLNPTENHVSLWQILRGTPDIKKGVAHVNPTTIGRSLMIIQWFFKWFNILRINRLIGMYPVPKASMDDKDVPYDNLQEVWTYVYVFGMFKDQTNEQGKEIL